MKVSNYNHPLANNIARVIESRGIKQYVIAQKAGLSKQEFNDMLKGRRVIKACDIPLIAAALDLTPNDLYELPSTHDPDKAN